MVHLSLITIMSEFLSIILTIHQELINIKIKTKVQSETLNSNKHITNSYLKKLFIIKVHKTIVLNWLHHIIFYYKTEFKKLQQS